MGCLLFLAMSLWIMPTMSGLTGARKTAGRHTVAPVGAFLSLWTPTRGRVAARDIASEMATSQSCAETAGRASRVQGAGIGVSGPQPKKGSLLGPLPHLPPLPLQLPDPLLPPLGPHPQALLPTLLKKVNQA